MKLPRIAATPSSGNVFADLGLPKPKMELLKAQLARRIREIIRRRRLTRAGVGAVLGLDPQRVFALLDGRLTRFSNERLIRFLTRFGQDVVIVLQPMPRHQRGQISVVETA